MWRMFRLLAKSKSSRRGLIRSTVPSALILAPNHPCLPTLLEGTASSGRLRGETGGDAAEIGEAADVATAEKDGFFTGRFAINPFSGENIPIWVGNFVVLNMEPVR